jgi:hypothetical protein
LANFQCKFERKSPKSGEKSPEFQNHQTEIEIIIIIIINDYHSGYIIKKLNKKSTNFLVLG